jgi:hypothetical protein
MIFREGAVGGFADVGGDTTGSQSAPFQTVRRPRWVSWIMQAAAVLVAGIGQALEPRHDLVAIGVQVAEHGRGVARDNGGAGGHGQRDAAFRLFLVVADVLVLGQAVFVVVGFVRGRHEPVAQGQVLELERLQQRVVGAVHGGHVEGPPELVLPSSLSARQGAFPVAKATD